MASRKLITQPHDCFFRKSMSNLKVAREFFSSHLPSNILKRIDLNTLAPQRESFVDSNLSLEIVDMLYSTKFKDEIGYIYILSEHQSQADKWRSYRLHKYMLKIYDYHFDKHPKSKYLPIVFPLVFYSGSKKYTAPLEIYSLFTDPKLAKSLYTKPFHLIELRNIPDKELRKKLWSGIMKLVMKRIFEQDILQFLKSVKVQLKEIGNKDSDYIYSILWYILEQAESSKTEEVIEIFKESVSEEQRGEIMSIAERIKQEGIQKGRTETVHEVALNMLKMKQPISLIAKATKLSEADIEKLLSHNKPKKQQH